MFANATPVAALAVPLHDERGVDVVILLAKATFARRGPTLVLLEEQAPLRLNDVPTDEAAVRDGRESSIRYPSDVCCEKPGADVVIVGSAVSSKAVSSLDVAVRAPGRSMSLTVHGERVFYKSGLGIKISPAAPFERAAITYERAYGGTSKDGTVVEWHNPVGRGAHRSTSELDGSPAPCIEDPAHPVTGTDATPPAGFGAIAMWWLPRRALSGTMDAAWQRERMPLPPLDFDRRFYHVAHPGLQLDRPLAAGDVIATHGLCPEGLFDVTIPELAIVAHLRRATGRAVSLPLALDTAVLEPDTARVELTFRRVVPLGRGDTMLREARLDVDA
ncbi:DUF2169 family type VI secretion system accessory protein [Sorangium sp. So ce204]|uniref:DUF2169 family type VI secretion system accessory protein n=1 Tax=Sorangium sp. So ce204 TaxID=3133288 RepID=UPI003F6307C0